MQTCECCDAEFPIDEGRLGDICTNCKWECDTLEDIDYDDSVIFDYSAANHATLNDYRRAWHESNSESDPNG